jgi:hypothetical protein
VRSLAHPWCDARSSACACDQTATCDDVEWGDRPGRRQGVAIAHGASGAGHVGRDVPRGRHRIAVDGRMFRAALREWHLGRPAWCCRAYRPLWKRSKVQPRRSR